MVICCDTSFLFSLYGDDANTPAALKWLAGSDRPLNLSRLNQFELANALRFAEFREAVPPGSSAKYWSDFEADVLQGRLLVSPLSLAALTEEAERLSTAHTLAGGHRSFDILHVAAALQLGASTFLTFDNNQRRLAEAEDLLVPLLEPLRPLKSAPRAPA